MLARTSSTPRRAACSIAQAALAAGAGRARLRTRPSSQNTRIRAPFSGVVVKKMAEVGESVAPIPPGVNISTSSGAIVALADLDTLEVEADVSESNVAKLGDRPAGRGHGRGVPRPPLQAVLRQVIPTADRTKATVQVKVTILDKDKDLRPEMSAKVHVPGAREGGGRAAARAAAPVVTRARRTRS